MKVNIKNYLKQLRDKAMIAYTAIKDYQDEENDILLKNVKSCLEDIVEELKISDYFYED